MQPAEDIVGAVGFSVMSVRPGDTCLAMGISDLPILAPGHLMSVMESACVAALAELVDNAETTIVDKFDISLIDSVGIGCEIRATARCTEVVDRTMIFECDVYDGERHIAFAIIERTVVERVSFLARTAAQSLINTVTNQEQN
ncbi:MAG: hotdog domain-containing protein [Candidatus Planktophila sp.]|jgi:fluoroacetyl-CoA thioesterase|tara:strand:+ start:1057 stop:1485 length:429 start_codon:yes stop_codon:yes gene_type:complete